MLGWTHGVDVNAPKRFARGRTSAPHGVGAQYKLFNGGCPAGAGTMRYVGLICEYFVAVDDAQATAVIDWPGGPSKPPPRQGWRRTPPEAPAAVSADGIDPVVLMAVLEGLLTNSDDGEIVDQDATRDVATRRGGERMIFATSDALIDALAALPADRALPVATQWATAEEFGGLADPVEFARGIGLELCRSQVAQRPPSDKGQAKTPELRIVNQRVEICRSAGSQGRAALRRVKEFGC